MHDNAAGISESEISLQTFTEAKMMKQSIKYIIIFEETSHFLT